MQVMQKIAAGQDTTMAYNAVVRQFGASLMLRDKGEAGFRNWLVFDMLPQLRPFVFGIMARIEGESLGQISLEFVKPGMKFEQAPAESGHETYVLLLNVAPGANMLVGQSGVMLLPGDVWWVNGGLKILFENNSVEDLVLLIVQAIPNSPATYVQA